MGTDIVKVCLPDLGDVDAVRVVEWRVGVGGTIAEDEDLVEVETEKTAFVVPAPAAGRLTRITAPAGATIRIGDVLGEIERA